MSYNDGTTAWNRMPQSTGAWYMYYRDVLSFCQSSTGVYRHGN